VLAHRDYHTVLGYCLHTAAVSVVLPQSRRLGCCFVPRLQRVDRGVAHVVEEESCTNRTRRTWREAGPERQNAPALLHHVPAHTSMTAARLCMRRLPDDWVTHSLLLTLQQRSAWMSTWLST
jgi:hypothetical protein